MARLFTRLVFESVLAAVFFLLGAWAIGRGDTLTLILGIAAVVVGFLVIVHVILAAAFGKVRTPTDMGVGFRVPGTPARTQAQVAEVNARNV